MLDLTWDQLNVVSVCVAEYRALQLDIVLQLVTGALGGKVKKRPHRQGKAAKPSKPSVDAAFAALGFPVDTVTGG